MKLLGTSPTKNLGLAAIEMTFVIPILILLGFGVVELVNVIQAKNISTSLAREGANLTSRSVSSSEQEIMDALATSANPLNFSKNGNIYITVVVGDDDPQPYILEQHKWLKHGFVTSSKIWSDCAFWSNTGSCIVPRAKPRLRNFPMLLSPGETVHVVEIMYDYSWVTKIIFNDNIIIYSEALM